VEQRPLTDDQLRIYEVVLSGVHRANDIAEAVGKTPKTTRSILLTLNGKGLIHRKRGVGPKPDSVEWHSVRAAP
jgi:hypothetical protein